MLAMKILYLTIFIILTINYQIPQVMMISSATFFNTEISNKLGPIIQNISSTYQIPDIPPFDEKISGVRVQVNLTNLKQKLDVNWNANVLQVLDKYNFKINSKNVNLTINASIQFKLGVGLKQKGELVIVGDKISMNTTLGFTRQTKRNSLGFNAQVVRVQVQTDALTIKIQGKPIDNLIIEAITRLLKPRIPQIIDNTVQSKVNPYLTQLTSSPMSDQFNFGTQHYILSLNTTDIPKFVDNQLIFPVDLTFTNQLTNQSNPQIKDENLPQDHIFKKTSNLTITLSANFINSLIWLIQDSKSLYIDISSLGPNPPIGLNTLNLSILLPDMYRKWPNKNVILRITPVNKFDSLFIRNGRILSSPSFAVSFIVNDTAKTSNVTECLLNKECISACTLNMSLPLSTSINLVGPSTVQGLLQSLTIQSIKVAQSKINLKPQNLKQVLNSMIGSSLSDINDELIRGMPINITSLENYTIIGLQSILRKDYAALGLLIDSQ